MKKKNKAGHYQKSSLSKSFGPLVLWLDDLEDIETRLQAHNPKLNIETEEYQFDSIAEFAEHFGGTIQRSLQITTSYPSFASIELTPRSATLSVATSGENASGAFFDLNEILSSRQRAIPWLYSFWIVQIVISIFWISMGLSWTRWLPENIDNWLNLFLMFLLPLLIWTLWIPYVRSRHYSLIRVEHKGTAKSFFQRNRDQLAVAVIAALFGAVLGAILGILGTNIMNKTPVVPTAVQNQPK
jgi:hypothetical protein